MAVYACLPMVFTYGRPVSRSSHVWEASLVNFLMGAWDILMAALQRQSKQEVGAGGLKGGNHFCIAGSKCLVPLAGLF